MAAIIDWIKKTASTPFGKVLEALVYALMILAVLMFFSGNGAFIYEAF